MAPKMAPPMWATLQYREGFRIWLPLFIGWILLLPFALLALPFVLIAALVFAAVDVRRAAALLKVFPAFYEVICSLKGLEIEVDQPWTRVRIVIR